MSKVQEILEERGAVYGDPRINLQCAFELKETFRYYAVHGNLSGAEKDAVEMMLTKIARIATGAYKGDNYDDVMGYATIAKNLGEDNDIKF